MDKSIRLTEAEIQSILNALDLAIKAGGIQNARAALPIVDKILSQTQPIQATQTN